jgi:hypothetical protein
MRPRRAIQDLHSLGIPVSADYYGPGTHAWPTGSTT